MALNPDLLRGALGARATAPVTINQAIAVFGGGARGKSELAQAMAGTRDKKSRAYKSAMRNLQRYTAGAGKQRRNPRRLTPGITRAVELRREKEAAAQIKGPVRVIWHGPVFAISQDVRERPDIVVGLQDDVLDEFREHLAEGDEQAAIDALARASVAAWFERDLSDIPGEILSATGLRIS